MNRLHQIALDKIINDFFSHEINVCIALAIDPDNPNVDRTIKRIYELIESSMVCFETLDIQSNEYKMIIKEMRIKETYLPEFGKSILCKNLYTTENLLLLICLHRSLIDCQALLKASLKIVQ